MQNKSPPTYTSYASYPHRSGKTQLAQLLKQRELEFIQMPKVDFTAVQDFQPREAGNVEAILLKHENSERPSASGYHTVKLIWHEAENENRMIFKTYSLNPKALWSFKRDLLRMGANPEEVNDPGVDTDDLIEPLYGTACTIAFGDPRPYKDKDGNDKIGDNFLEVVDPTK